jgi:hypothetical protein
MSGYDQFLGIVQNGLFRPLAQNGLRGPVRLTKIQMQEARSPESGKFNLSEYESCAIMVQGYDSGGWIYSANVIDHAGPILTFVVSKVFIQNKRKNKKG